VSDKRKIETSTEVWAVIRAAHPEMLVFATASSTGDMYTEYGFPGAACPTIAARTTWDYGENYRRLNERHEYWICVPTGGGE